jgi:LysM repeat protein
LKRFLALHKRYLSPLCITSLLLLHCSLAYGAQEEGEETYSITLTKTAEIDEDQDTYEVKDKKVLGETYTVQEGEWLWQILRERGLLKKKNLPELLTVLKSLNQELANLDQIHPGQKIIIPLTIVPLEGIPVAPEPTMEAKADVKSLKEIDLQKYTVKPGDSLIRIIENEFNIPEQEQYGEYLDLVKKLNPFIEDLDRIEPGQVIKLPIFSPKLVRKPIKKSLLKPQQEISVTKDPKVVSYHLKQIFTEMGEEWISTGQHFIPFKSGGQINLKAESYPILNLKNGRKVIVDLLHDLPEKMVKLILANWESYRIVHLKEDTLKTALDKILAACNYHRIFGTGEALEVGGEIPLKISADWIIETGPGQPSKENPVSVLTLLEGSEGKTPKIMKAYLEGKAIKTIEFPSGADHEDDSPAMETEPLITGEDPVTLIALVMHFAGQPFSKNEEISVYKSEKTGLQLIINADFFFQRNGKGHIIDLSGLSSDILPLLKEQNYRALTLAGEKDPGLMVSKSLDFLGVPFDPNPHPFLASKREAAKNIQFTVPGILFKDHEGKPVLATKLVLPQGILTLLGQRGFRVLSLSFP